MRRYKVKKRQKPGRKAIKLSMLVLATDDEGTDGVERLYDEKGVKKEKATEESQSPEPRVKQLNMFS
jgi:hypothetical protein